MASKTKIYIVLELVTGGELFDKIVRHSLTFLFCLQRSIIVIRVYYICIAFLQS